jgi:hypothetical protein
VTGLRSARIPKRRKRRQVVRAKRAVLPGCKVGRAGVGAGPSCERPATHQHTLGSRTRRPCAELMQPTDRSTESWLAVRARAHAW